MGTGRPVAVEDLARSAGLISLHQRVEHTTAVAVSKRYHPVSIGDDFGVAQRPCFAGEAIPVGLIHDDAKAAVSSRSLCHAVDTARTAGDDYSSSR